MDIIQDLNDVVETLTSPDFSKIQDRSHGWKAANKRLRKATLSAEKALKAIRKASVELEKE